VRAFAAKFASLKRWHRVLHGEDVLARVDIPENLERFLCEQALRNLRLRTAHAFVLNERHHGYGQHLKRIATEVVLRFSDVVRLSGVELPARPEDRIPPLERELGIEGKTLHDLLALRAGALPWRESDAQEWHARVFGALDSVLRRIEQSWPEPG
jgi:hypothetical protein